MNRLRVFAKGVCLVIALSLYHCPPLHAQEPSRHGIWLMQRDNEFGNQILTAELILTPMAESKPALKHKFIPNEFELLDGNAAIFYLKAMGFFEQNHARDIITETQKRAVKTAQETGEDITHFPPFSWQDMSPKDLPINEVKTYLSLFGFQPQDLAEATRRRSFSLDRNIRQVDSPIGILLPDIQSIRELARTQSLRCRFAIAEGRVDDAITILGQQYAMAKHLGTDETLVSNLVGAATAGINFEDGLYLLQLPTTPNLYWAFASLPNPIIDMKTAAAFECQWLFEEVKLLRTVDETPRNAGYWQDFIDRILPKIQTLDLMGNGVNAKDTETVRATLVATIAAAYPGALRFLIEEVGMDRNLVTSYSTAQTFFLAVKRFYERTLNEQFKWNAIPFADAMANQQYRSLDARTRADCERVGWASLPTTALLPSIAAARTAQQRVQQGVAMLQTIEAIRLYGAANGGKLPDSLASLTVPAPVDPFTGKPIAYELSGDKAVLTGYRMPGLQNRIVVRFDAK